MELESLQFMLLVLNAPYDVMNAIWQSIAHGNYWLAPPGPRTQLPATIGLLNGTVGVQANVYMLTCASVILL